MEIDINTVIDRDIGIGILQEKDKPSPTVRITRWVLHSRKNPHITRISKREQKKPSKLQYTPRIEHNKKEFLDDVTGIISHSLRQYH